MITYTIDIPALLEKIKEEVSHVADNAVAENGASLYDYVMVSDKDKPVLEGYIDSSVNEIVRRAFDIAHFATTYAQARSGDDALYYQLDEHGNPDPEDIGTEVTDYPVFTDEVTGRQIVFDVPDFDTTMEPALDDELTRFIVLGSCTSYFLQRYPQKAPDYAERSQASLHTAITLLKSRKYPQYVS